MTRPDILVGASCAVLIPEPFAAAAGLLLQQADWVADPTSGQMVCCAAMNLVCLQNVEPSRNLSAAAEAELHPRIQLCSTHMCAAAGAGTYHRAEPQAAVQALTVESRPLRSLVAEAPPDPLLSLLSVSCKQWFICSGGQDNGNTRHSSSRLTTCSR